ncbi:MAG: PHP domain-containing protein [Dissulfuribacterales bacterium]
MTTPDRVLFERPLLSELTRDYTVVDMHFHSRYSDGFNDIKSIVQRARRLGIGIAITDHNEIKGAIQLGKVRDILTIPGIELTSKEGSHLLVYLYDFNSLSDFYKTHVRPFMGKGVMASLSLEMEEIVRRAQKYESLVIFPHPYCAIYTGVCNAIFSKQRQAALFDMVDGVEVINAGNLKKWNLQCAVLGFNLDKSMTGGSDGHNLFQMGKAVTYTEYVTDRIAFLDEIKQTRNRVVGKEIDLLRKVTSNSCKIRSNIKNYPHVFGKNVRFSYTVLNTKSRQVKNTMQRTIKKRMRRA